MTRVRIGTSGFGIARSKYVQTFPCVEVQHTFYQPPKISTLQRWRDEAPLHFEFVLKAWQLITHDAKSPTYRRPKKKLSEVEKQEAGYFRPTTIVKDAWQVTLECARTLKTRTILFQCPASFRQTKENISNLEKFFGNIDRQDNQGRLNLGWEPRGDWEPKVLKRICQELNLWHAVDPFTTKSVTPDKLYFRLHGRNGWRYEYDEGELRELAAMLTKQSGTMNSEPGAVATGSAAMPVNTSGTTNSEPGVVATGSAAMLVNTSGTTNTEPGAVATGSAADKAPYVFFNNARMIQDALKFQEIIADS